MRERGPENAERRTVEPAGAERRADERDRGDVVRGGIAVEARQAGNPFRPLKPPVTDSQLFATWKASSESASVIIEKYGPLSPRRRNTRIPITNASSPEAQAASGISTSSHQLCVERDQGDAREVGGEAEEEPCPSGRKPARPQHRPMPSAAIA